MRDLIDRAEAIEEIARRDTTDGTIKVYSGREVVKILNELPSAQPEIIRCKDCKHFELSKDELARQYEISGCFRLKNLSAEYPLLTDGNGFCSWAERRTDETD